MTFLQTGQATTDPEFNLRVQACIFKIAQDVMNESPGADNHPRREALARRVILNPSLLVGQFVWLCAANPTIAGTVSADGPAVDVGAPDSDLEYVCVTNWDVVSGWGMEIPH